MIVEEEIDKFKKLEFDNIKDEKSWIPLIKEIYGEKKYENDRNFKLY